MTDRGKPELGKLEPGQDVVVVRSPNALGHRGENRGEECWTRWHPSDFRQMVNDVAAQFGVAEFPQPGVAKEDEIR